MSHQRRPSSRKRNSKAIPILGAAGLSLSLAGGVSAASAAPTADIQTQNTKVSHEITLYEEEISDVSLGTFYVFDKEKVGIRRHGLRFAQGGGCGCGRGSDIRLKRDIAQVGEHNGINLYRFRYLWSYDLRRGDGAGSCGCEARCGFARRGRVSACPL